MNLWEETKDVLEKNNKTFNDVIAVCCSDFRLDFKNFIEIAIKTNYDNGFGGQEIATDLILIGEDFWLERAEYDGSEWWEYKEKPEIPKEKKIIKKLGGGAWDTLWEINAYFLEGE